MHPKDKDILTGASHEATNAATRLECAAKLIGHHDQAKLIKDAIADLRFAINEAERVIINITPLSTE